VRTPGKALLLAKTAELALLLRDEWDAQGERIDPGTMPVTRLVNTAIDGVAAEMQGVREDVIRYAGSDLLCYRADGPDELIERQTELWDPLVEWAQATLGARFVLAQGVIHTAQPPETIAAIGVHVGLIDNPVQLACVHSITALTGSAIIAVAVLKEHTTAEEAWALAHVDEDWQVSRWGEDHEAQARRAARWREMNAACCMLKALG
jgi:chaperone required for assembly of F1-ATPase